MPNEKAISIWGKFISLFATYLLEQLALLIRVDSLTLDELISMHELLSHHSHLKNNKMTYNKKTYVIQKWSSVYPFS